MKWILSCWGDDHCAKLPPHGKLISVECILLVTPDATNNAQGLIGVDVCGTISSKLFHLSGRIQDSFFY
jgi:flavonol 3-O-methyltransferase/caffeic acid 3-O-methyltransferase